MSDYRVGLGHNLALASLTVLVPQPRSGGVQATLRRYSGSGAIYEEGYYIEMIWDVLPNAAAYQAVLEQFNLFTSQTQEITLYAPGPDFSYMRHNGLAVRPQTGQDVRQTRFGIRDVVILVRDMAEAA